MKKNAWKTVLTVVVLLALAAALVVAAVECANGASLANTAWSLLPPVIAIILALITKEAYSALFIGVLVGGLFTCGFAPVATLDTIVNDGLIAAISGNAGIFLFLVLLGIIVALVNAAGGSAAFGRWAETHIKTRVGAQLATFVLGVLIFIDDYFNCLTVGSVMRQVTDNHKISRPKLAYLIDATAAPVCMGGGGLHHGGGPRYRHERHRAVRQGHPLQPLFHPDLRLHPRARRHEVRLRPHAPV